MPEGEGCSKPVFTFLIGTADQKMNRKITDVLHYILPPSPRSMFKSDPFLYLDLNPKKD